MQGDKATGFRVLALCAQGHARIVEGLDRLTDVSTRVFGGFLDAALTIEERGELGIALYDRRATGPQRTGLAHWERAWFDSELPQAPARILVGAAGTGREVAELRRRGLEVDAFEPSARSVDSAGAPAGTSSRIRVGRYEDLSASVLDARRTPLSPIAGVRYDAILLGWGSLSHVLAARERDRLFAACRWLCPEGPVLASFWFDEGGTTSRWSRAERLGRRLGTTVSWMRGAPVERTGDAYSPRLGFCHSFTETELKHLAESRGYRMELRTGPYAHATFRPKGPSTALGAGG